METVAVIIVIAIIAAGAGSVIRRKRRNSLQRERAGFIQQYAFPPELRNRLQRNHDLSLAASGKVLEGLRQYFLACLAAQRSPLAKEVGMPSKAVDAAWHEFIVLTKAYADFCQKAFGKYLHHTPKAMMDTPTKDALANTLHQLKQPSIAPAAYAMVGTVPLLFALDRELGFKDGYVYDEPAIQDLEVHRQAQLAAVSGSDGGSGSWSSGGGGDSPGDSGGGGDGGGGGCGGGSS